MGETKQNENPNLNNNFSSSNRFHHFLLLTLTYPNIHSPKYKINRNHLNMEVVHIPILSLFPLSQYISTILDVPY